MAEAPLDVALYQRAQRIFEEVADLPAADRGEAVDARCGDDEALKRLVGRLLAMDAEDGSGETMDLMAPARAVALEVVEETEGPPERFGRFRILRELGRGGMGVVYAAEQDAPKRKVAVKTLHPLMRSAKARAQFGTEVDALGRVLHPGIPQVYEVFDTEDGVPAMAMELVDGGPLLQAVYLLDFDQRAEMLAKVCDAVDHAHRHGVIHRDLKPDNVLVTVSGQPKVLDFGIARLDGEAVPQAGTLGYMAPELLEGGAPTVASDVYSLGAVGWEMVTGARPVEPTRGEAIEVLAARKRQAVPDAPEVPEGLVAILQMALSPEPDHRFHSARRMAQELRAEVEREVDAAEDFDDLWADDAGFEAEDSAAEAEAAEPPASAVAAESLAPVPPWAWLGIGAGGATLFWFLLWWWVS